MAEKTFERTPKDLIIGIAMTLCGGVLWGVNATVSKILMGTYHASPLWIACVRELAAGVLFLTCSAIMTPKLLTGALRDRKSYPRLLATAIICVLLVQVAYLESINWTNSGTATVLQSLNLLFVLGVVCLRAATARRTGRHRRGARLRGNRADCDRRRLHHAETAVGRPDLGRYQRGVHGGHGVSSGQAHRTLGQLHRQWHRVPDFRACAAAVRAAVGYGAAVGLAGCGADGVHRDRRHHSARSGCTWPAWCASVRCVPPCSAPANR